MKHILLLILLPTLLLIPGCVFVSEDYIAPATYDFARPEAESSVAVNRIKVRNISGADRRFLYRSSNNLVKSDEYNRWLLEPELLIERALCEVFGKRSCDGIEAACRIQVFEFDLVRKVSRLKLEVRFSHGTSSCEYTKTWETSFDAKRSSSAAESMNKTVSKALADIVQECEKFSARLKGDKK